ncbi:hypothetical protein [Oleiagrimonas sp. MCCC 1A03011]|uniref:hypothetical protein n=1 Tax=Oleiagrimonas sp. MCCC 1A03011 TaxID=1926883 RepID=UPI0011BF2D50|nr:hypothetical protein [Oleiagrimonas sp. MCCC 1A03011]
MDIFAKIAATLAFAFGVIVLYLPKKRFQVHIHPFESGCQKTVTGTLELSWMGRSELISCGGAMRRLWVVLNWVVLIVLLLTEVFVLLKGQARGLLGLLLALPYASVLYADRKPRIRWRPVVALTLNGLMLCRAIWTMVFAAQHTWAVQSVYSLLVVLLLANIWMMVRNVKRHDRAALGA